VPAQLQRLDVIPGHDRECLADVDRLFREYAAGLGHDLCFQDFDKELATLPGKYAPPEGRILLAVVPSGKASASEMSPAVAKPSSPRHVYPLAAAQNLVEPHHFRANQRQDIAGCVALRKIGDGICEMKRLYIRPAYRRLGIGRALATAVVHEARAIGYDKMRLDTLSSMTEAVTLYQSIGFVHIPAYYANPICGAVYMELDLTATTPEHPRR